MTCLLPYLFNNAVGFLQLLAQFVYSTLVFLALALRVL